MKSFSADVVINRFCYSTLYGVRGGSNNVQFLRYVICERPSTLEIEIYSSLFTTNGIETYIYGVNVAISVELNVKYTLLF